MSYQASSWALRDAPVGADTTKRLILMALADFAGPDGTGAYPSVETLCGLVRLKRRAVMRHLGEMEQAGVIRRGDQRLTLHYRADRRPVVWDLAMPPAGRSGMPVTQERAIMDSLDDGDVHDGAPRDAADDMHDHAPRPAESDVHAGAPRDHDDVHAGAPRRIPRGARQGTNGVHRRAPKPSVKPPYNPPVVPQGGPAPRSKTRKPRTPLPDDWHPNQAARDYCRDHGIDCDWCERKFSGYMLANAVTSNNWDGKFASWLERERSSESNNRSDPPKAPHTHTWKCAHVLRLLHRDEDDAGPDDLACDLAVLLNHGMADDAALTELGLPADDMWEAA